MKNLYNRKLLLIAFVFLLGRAFAQPTFLGATYYGGENNLGTVFSTDTDGTNYQVQYQGAFMVSDTYGKLLEVSNGIFYGMAANDNYLDNGGIFEYNATTGIYTLKHIFDGTNGKAPQGSLIKAANGKLYGLTSTGGANGEGVIFEYDYINNVYTKKKDLFTTLGSYPIGSFFEASNGKLYALTSYDGANNAGTLLEFDYNTNTLTKRFDFSSANGVNPNGGVIERSGVLYGTTESGGASNGGVLFKFDLNTLTYIVLYDFTGAYIVGSPMIASNGKMYGITRQSGTNFAGEIYEYDFTSSTLAFKVSLDDIGYSGGNGTLVETSTGKLFGLCYGGGANGRGGIYEYTIGSNSISQRFDFSDVTAHEAEYESFILGNDGLIYGLTPAGGTADQGVLYTFNPTTFEYLEKHSFLAGEMGNRPRFFMKATNGKIYGLAYDGGIHNQGTLFEFDPITYEQVTLASFSWGETGYGPIYMMEASNGKLYGRTYRGGSSDRGVLFEFDLATNTLAKKVDFTNTTGGLDGGLIEVSGVLYGNGRFGGTSFEGTIFKYDISTQTISAISVNGAGISTPFGPLVKAGNGKLYGTSAFGGANNIGTIYEYDPTSNTLNKKVDLSASLGSKPWGGMVAYGGKLWGMTSEGGFYGEGLIFEYDPTNNVYVTRADFSASINGKLPTGNLMVGSNGKLYGYTTGGGTNGFGTLFEFNPSTFAVTVKKNFTENTNTLDRPGFLFEECTVPQFDQPADVDQCNGTAFTLNVNSPNTDSYVWKKDGVTIPGQTTGTFSVGTAAGTDSGTYTCELTNTCGTEIVSTNVSITEITLSMNVTNVTCNGANDGRIGAVVGGANSPIQSSIDGVNFKSGAFTDLAPGNYTYTVRDSKGCEASQGVTITEPPVLNINTTQTNITCSGGLTGTITTSASGGTSPYQYAIDGTNYQTATNFTGLAAGTYIVTVKDANDCVAPATVNVTEPSTLVLGTTVSNISCNGQVDGSVKVSASGGASGYEFSIDGTNFSSVTSFDNLAAGNYTIIVKDANGCETSEQLSIIEPMALSASLSESDITCNGAEDGTISFTTSGGTGVIEASIDGTNFQVGDFTGLAPGNYTVTFKDENGCTIMQSTTLSEPDAINATVSKTDIVCPGESAGAISISALGGTAPLEYSVNGTSFQSSSDFAGLSAGNYTVTVKDANGCIYTEPITITEPNVFSFNETIVQILCNGGDGGSISVAATGGTSPYEYSIDGTNFSIVSEFTDLGPGTYTIHLIDSKGCSYSEDYLITEPDALSVTADFNGESVDLIVTGGTSPYEYSSDGTNFQSESNFILANGSYTFTAKDANGCVAETSENIVVTAINGNGFQRDYIYPNPSVNKVYFSGKEGFNEAQIIDLSGKVVLSSPLQGNAEFSLDISSLKKGVYVLILKNTNSKTLQFRMVKD